MKNEKDKSMIAEFEGAIKLYCPWCGDKFKVTFDGNRVTCSFCGSTVREKDVPDYPNDLNATMRAAGKIRGGDHLVVHANRDLDFVGEVAQPSQAAAGVVNKFDNGDWTYNESPARARSTHLPPTCHITRRNDETFSLHQRLASQPVPRRQRVGDSSGHRDNSRSVSQGQLQSLARSGTKTNDAHSRNRS